MPGWLCPPRELQAASDSAGCVWDLQETGNCVFSSHEVNKVETAGTGGPRLCLLEVGISSQ